MPILSRLIVPREPDWAEDAVPDDSSSSVGLDAPDALVQELYDFYPIGSEFNKFTYSVFLLEKTCFNVMSNNTDSH